VDSTRRPGYRRRDGKQEGTLMWPSLVMTAVVAASFAASHYSLT
jgi:hypothetical protein